MTLSSLPAVLLQDPMRVENVGAALRACVCYGIPNLWVTGDRARRSRRLSAEVRRNGIVCGGTRLSWGRPSLYAYGAPPLYAMDVLPGARPLSTFMPVERAVYVFGPEDGSVSADVCEQATQRVYIPSRVSLSLGAAVYTTLYDRQCKLGLQLPPVEAVSNVDLGWGKLFGER